MDTPGYDPVAATGQIAGGGAGGRLHHRARLGLRLEAGADDQGRDQRPALRADARRHGHQLRRHREPRASRSRTRAREILDMVLRVASGEKTKSEALGPRRQRVRALAGRRGDVTRSPCDCLGPRCGSCAPGSRKRGASGAPRDPVARSASAEGEGRRASPSARNRGAPAWRARHVQPGTWVTDLTDDMGDTILPMFSAAVAVGAVDPVGNAERCPQVHQPAFRGRFSRSPRCSMKPSRTGP